MQLRYKLVESKSCIPRVRLHAWGHSNVKILIQSIIGQISVDADRQDRYLDRGAPVVIENNCPFNGLLLF